MARECITLINALQILNSQRRDLDILTKVLFQSETGLLLQRNMVWLSLRTNQSFQSNKLYLSLWGLQQEKWEFLQRNITLHKSHFTIQRSLNILKNHHIMKSLYNCKDLLYMSKELVQDCKLHQILIKWYCNLQPSNSTIKIQSKNITLNQWEVDYHQRELLLSNLKLFTIMLLIILLPEEEEQFNISQLLIHTMSLSTWRSQCNNTMRHLLKLQ